MKLDFSVLSSTPDGGPRGTSGTVHNHSGFETSDAGDSVGTQGDNMDSLGPRLSPSSPLGEMTEFSNISAESPMSPVVPAASDMALKIESDSFEERAAIMEFDGGLSREEAERVARLFEV